MLKLTTNTLSILRKQGADNGEVNRSKLTGNKRRITQNLASHRNFNRGNYHQQSMSKNLQQNSIQRATNGDYYLRINLNKLHSVEIEPKKNADIKLRHYKSE